MYAAMIGGFFVFGQGAQASHGTYLVISEVQVAGSVVDDEFIELYNSTGSAVDISGFSIQYKSATGATFQKKNFDSGANIPAHGFYLIARSAFDGGVTADMTQGTFSLAGTGGNIFLVSNQTLLTSAADASIVDKAAYGTGDSPENTAVTAPPANQSIERKPGGSEGNGTDTDNNANDFSLQSTPNPQNSSSTPVPAISPPPPAGPVCGNSTCETGEDYTSCSADCAAPPPATPTYTVGSVVINELIPNPTNSIEWVELYNKTPSAVDIAGWKLFDGTDNSIKSLSGTISATGFLSFDLSSARLNNSGDIVVLKAPDSTVIDVISYGDWDDGNVADNAPTPANAGQSVARKSNGADTGVDSSDFMLSDAPSKGATNVIVVNTTETVYQGSNTPQTYTTPVPKIVINEFVADPEDGPEWAELYNTGEVSVELEGWIIEEGAGRKTKLSGTFIPGQYKVIEEIAGNLNNKGDIIRLKNDKGEVVDAVAYGTWEDGDPKDNASASGDPNSVARAKDGADTNVDQDDFAVTKIVTKGKANVIEAVAEVVEVAKPAQISAAQKFQSGESKKVSEAVKVSPRLDVIGKLFISEILPDPEGSDEAEFVELYWNGSEPLQLKGFQVDDDEGGSRPFTLSDILIKAQDYLVLPRTLTKLALNNNGDSVRLLDPAGNLINEVQYEDSASGRSFARREDGKWLWTAPTPGGVNVFDTEAVEEVVDAEKAAKEAEVNEIALKDVRELEVGDQVRVSGVVAVLPGVLGSQIFYLAGSGIQVYMYKKDFPKLAVGDLISVEGQLSQSGGEMRIKVKERVDIAVEKHGAPPAPHEVAAADIGEELEGSLVKVAGTIIDVTKTGIMLDDGDGEILVVIKPTTDIDAKELTPGTKVTVTGIVSQTKSGYRVLPRFQEDIEVTGRDEVAAGLQPASGKDESSPYAKATAYAGGGAALFGLGIRRRKMFVTGARAVWFLIRKNSKKGLI